VRHPGCACFWLEPTGNVRLSLRRFTFGGRGRNCPAAPNGMGHNASVQLDREIPLVVAVDADGWRSMEMVPEGERPPDDDPAWPTACEACGGPFLEGDEWQVNQAEVYTRSDGGEVAFRGYQDPAMAGALWHAWWLEGPMGGVRKARAGEDGIILMAMTPGGYEWVVDGEATGGGGWTREGDPRRPETLTVTPSIVAGDYHGFLQAGRFTDDLGS
jgi:hypothetical protein